MSEVYINNNWILLDNNCTYVDDYDYANPYISVMNSNEKGLFVFANISNPEVSELLILANRCVSCKKDRRNSNKKF